MELVTSICEFMETLFFELSKKDGCEIIYSVFDHDPKILESLIRRADEFLLKGHDSRSNAIISVVHSLFRKRAPPISTVFKNQSNLIASLTEAKPKPLVLVNNVSSIESVCSVIRKKLGAHIESLCNFILLSGNGSGSDKVVFSTSRLRSIEIFYEAIRDSNFMIPDIFSRVDARVWKVIVDWFFDYP